MTKNVETKSNNQKCKDQKLWQPKLVVTRMCGNQNIWQLKCVATEFLW